MDTKRKSETTMNVSRKISFSSPLFENELEPPKELDLPSPVPLA